MIYQFIDSLWYYLGYVDRCDMCRYKNMVCYQCPNDICKKKYCRDCYIDTTIQENCCKLCRVVEWDGEK